MSREQHDQDPNEPSGYLDYGAGLGLYLLHLKVRIATGKVSNPVIGQSDLFPSLVLLVSKS